MLTGTQTGENGNDEIPLGGILAPWGAPALPVGRRSMLCSGVDRCYKTVGSLNF